MKDLIDRNIKIGDYVIYIKPGRGTFRAIHGYVIGFTKCKVNLIIDYYLNNTCCFPESIIVCNDIPQEKRKNNRVEKELLKLNINKNYIQEPINLEENNKKQNNIDTRISKI